LDGQKERCNHVWWPDYTEEEIRKSHEWYAREAEKERAKTPSS
jgi:hypothetical protein